MLNVVPCSVQENTVVYPFYIQWSASAKPKLPVPPSPLLFWLGCRKAVLEPVPPSSASSFVRCLMESLFLIFFISSPNAGLGFSDIHSLCMYHFPSFQWTGNSVRFCNNRRCSNSSGTQRVNQGTQVFVSVVKRLNLFSPTWLSVSLLFLKIVQVWWLSYYSHHLQLFFF